MLYEENSEIIENYFIRKSQLSNQNNLINTYNSNSKSSSLMESGNIGINDYEKMKNDKSKNHESKIKEKKISLIKKSILGNETERQFDNDKKYNNSNKNVINVYKRKYSFMDLSSIQNNKKYTNTPNREIPKKEKSNDYKDIKKRPFTPNIAFNDSYNKNYIPIYKKNINLNQIKSDRKGEINYEKILEKNLKDLDKQINLMSRGYSFSENKNKNNYFNKSYSLEQSFGGTQYYNYNSHENKNRRKINDKPYNKNNNDNSFVINKNNRFSIPHSVDKNNKHIKYYDNNSNYNNNNNLTKNPLFDLASSNTNDINRRIENLEKYVIDIKKDISSMSSILSNLSKNNFFQNNIRNKEQFKEEYNEYFNEKMSNEENYKDKIKYRDSSNYNNNNDNHSMYSEFLNDENRKKNMNEIHKKYEKEINKKIDQKLQILGEEIKNQIYDKFISPSIEQIENVMKQNIDEIKDRINEINYNNALYKISDNYFNKNNKLLQSRASFDLDTRQNSLIRNEKYKEINRLSEKLYQKLNLKAQKIRLLKEETSKYLKEQ